MQLWCKVCRAPIGADDVNIDKLVAKCRACNAVFAFERDLPRAGRDGAFRAPGRTVLERRRPRVPLPERFALSEDGGALRISWRWFSAMKHLPLLFFCIAWDSFLVFWYSAALGAGPSEASVMMLVFPIAHVAVGVGLTYSVLAGILNRTVISASGSELRVAHGPVPWLGNRGVPVADIAQLYSEEHRSEGKNGATFSYRLSAVGRDGRKLALVKGLPERDQALYLEQAFEDALGIQDEPVGGEMAA